MANIIIMEDLLENVEQTCMYCGKKCTSKDGTWPQYVRISETEVEPMMDADWNTRDKEEFVCYDCLD